MKKALIIGAALFLLFFAGSAVWAQGVPTINIYDLTEGKPLVTTADFTSMPHIDNPLIFTLKEFASVTGTLFDDFH